MHTMQQFHTHNLQVGEAATIQMETHIMEMIVMIMELMETMITEMIIHQPLLLMIVMIKINDLVGYKDKEFYSLMAMKIATMK